MNLSIKALETFLELYNRKNFKETATVLGIKQPTVTYRIRELEAFLGQKLVITQNNRKLAFTEFAQDVIPHLLTIESNLNFVKGYGRSDDAKRNIKIISGEIAGLYFLPVVLKNFRDKFPDTEVDLIMSSSQNVIRNVKNGNADIGFASSKEFIEIKAMERSFRIEALLPIDLVVITPKGHPLGRMKSVAPTDIVTSKANYISRSQTSGIQQEFLKMLKAEGYTLNDLNTVLTLENSSSVISAVAEGLGISVASWLQTSRFVETGIIDYALIKTPVQSYVYYIDRWNGRYTIINNFRNMVGQYLEYMPKKFRVKEKKSQGQTNFLER